jgi:hypothetical protein
MSQTCYKCGQTVEQGIPFCPECRAPQIRVVLPDPPQASDGARGSAETFQASRTSAEFPEADANLDSSFPVPSGMIRWAQGLPAAAMAGLAAGLGMTLVGLFGLWMMAGGFLSVFLYRRRTRGSQLLPRAGARLGAVSGILGFGLFSMITVPTGFFRAMMTEMVTKYGQRSDPEVRALSESWLEILKTPGGIAVWLICLFFLMLIASAIGGALGGALLGRRRG